MKTSSIAVETLRSTTQSDSILRQTNKRSSYLSYTTMNNKHIFNEIQFVEKKTRLQRKDSNWYLCRKGRITTSKCKRVASLKPTTSLSKTLKELLLCDRVPQTSAMLQGLENEDDIEDTFLSKMEMEGKHRFSFTKCGFFISKTHGFLGASPDRII